MSKELYLAAEQGNLAEVKRLLTTPDIEVDILCEYQHQKNFRFTPLAIALRNKHWDVAKCLLTHGSSVYKDVDNQSKFDILLPINILLTDRIPLDLTKDLLKQLASLNIYLKHEKNSEVKRAIYSDYTCSRTNLPDYYFMEAILRHEKSILEFVIKSENKPLLNANIFQLYLKDTPLDNNLLMHIELSIAFLLERKYISPQIVKEISQAAQNQYDQQHNITSSSDPLDTSLCAKIDSLRDEVRQLKQLQQQHMVMLQQLLQPTQNQGNSYKWFKPYT